jgi:hypothetical protein
MIEREMFHGTRRALRERVRGLPADGDPGLRYRRLRAVLEEVGVHCDDTADLHDVDAVLLASGRGTEALIAARLDDGERVVGYARIIARLLTGDLTAPVDFKIEYADSSDAPSKRERDEERMVLTLAQAIASGHIDEAPRPLFQDVPAFTFAFTPRSISRSTLGGFHWWSNLWYRRSGTYRAWRRRRDVSDAIGRVCGILARGASLPAA